MDQLPGGGYHTASTAVRSLLLVVSTSDLLHILATNSVAKTIDLIVNCMNRHACICKESSRKLDRFGVTLRNGSVVARVQYVRHKKGACECLDKLLGSQCTSPIARWVFIWRPLLDRLARLCSCYPTADIFPSCFGHLGEILTTVCAIRCAVTCASLPRGWVASQQPGSPTGQLPRIILPLADPEEFLDRHSNILGINARNVLNIAPSVSGSYS